MILRGILGLGLLAMAACAPVPSKPVQEPKARPTAPPDKPQPPQTPQPSQSSRDLAQYYARVQANLLSQGLLRRDGGGADTPYTATDLLRNFEQIAFYDEYERNRGLKRSDGRPGQLRKWAGPVRVAVEFGATVPQAQRSSDRVMVGNYVARLARATQHPVSISGPGQANFTVLVMGQDDRAQAVARIRSLVPDINPASLALFQNLPRSIHCFVVAFSGPRNDQIYRRAIALVRAEHPELMRRSCVHEELAQGLGLANDSPRARPSIFNDDDEFALLTRQDEVLLRLLYAPGLTPGMSVDDARPILTRLIAQYGPGPR